MKYFMLYDDLAPEGDFYRFDGEHWQCRLTDGSWEPAYASYGEGTEWLDHYAEAGKLNGNPNSRWEEIECPES